jgi:crotonobetainyl-CoA:carnitine CoA-transferase CaiB-like acyl-CoA transferase
VETHARPDGTRAGNAGFFDWTNSGKLCYSIDFDSEDLTRLLRAADVVIEGSRPAALARRGRGAEQLAARAGRVWVRISGYGCAHPDRVAFGDDAAVAGGLVMPGPVFCGDAIADPLTALAAADAVLNAVTAGGGVIIDVPMAGIAAEYAALPVGQVHRDVPRTPALPLRAHRLGEDNSLVTELVGERLVRC